MGRGYLPGSRASLQSRGQASLDLVSMRRRGRWVGLAHSAPRAPPANSKVAGSAPLVAALRPNRLTANWIFVAFRIACAVSFEATLRMGRFGNPETLAEPTHRRCILTVDGSLAAGSGPSAVGPRLDSCPAPGNVYLHNLRSPPLPGTWDC